MERTQEERCVKIYLKSFLWTNQIQHLLCIAGLIKQFLRDVNWGEVDFLVVDTPPGTSDEHLSVVQYLKDAGITGAVIVTTPQVILRSYFPISTVNWLSFHVYRKFHCWMFERKSTFVARFRFRLWGSSRT